MPAADAAALLRSNADDTERRDRPALRFADRVWTHAEYVAECHRFANLFLERRPAGASRGTHVGVLLDNTPDYVFALGGAALAGATVVGLNHTRRDEHLLRDVQHTDCDLVVTEPRHLALLGPITKGLPEVLVSRRAPDAGPPDTETDVAPQLGADLDDALRAVAPTDAGIEPGPDTLWSLIFTSGTSDAPKAVICTQRRFLVTGNRMGIIMDLGPDDVGYVCMPLFHSNALMVGWAPSLVYGASVGLARQVQRVEVLVRRSPLRSHLLQLHRQTPRIHPLGARASRRREQPTACRVRERGVARGRRRVRRAGSGSR